MNRAAAGLLVLVCAAALPLWGQTPKPAGLQTEWDIGVVLGEMSAHAGRLLEALDKVDAPGWVKKGASDGYVQQLESSKQQARAFAQGAKALAGNPDKLSDSLELLFRIEAVEAMLGSLGQGIHDYQSPEAAQTLASLVAENGVNRDRFRQYIVELAAQREKQFEVMDSEAQRCRALMAAQPVPAANKDKKK